MDALTKFETAFQKPRTAWTKAEWRKVAMSLAGIEPVETRGRKPKTQDQHQSDRERILVAKFWIDQERLLKESTSERGVLGIRSSADKIYKIQAAKKIIREAAQREGISSNKPSAQSLLKQIQLLEIKQRKK